MRCGAGCDSKELLDLIGEKIFYKGEERLLVHATPGPVCHTFFKKMLGEKCSYMYYEYNKQLKIDWKTNSFVPKTG
jgi:hypothetical protein